MVYYQDDKIQIRDIREEDIIQLFTWWVDEEINLYDPRPLPRDPKALMKECNNYCECFMKEVMNKKKTMNRYRYFIITDKVSKPIGFINIFSFNHDYNEAELGIIIGKPTYWRKGIAYEGMKVVLQRLFEEEHFKRIHIETGRDNKPAKALFLKLGFKNCSTYIDEGFRFDVMDMTKKRYLANRGQ